MSNKTDIFQRPLWVALFALTAAVAWGWAFPLVKVGFAEFAITSDMTGAKMLFAGLRFAFAGLLLLVVAILTKRNFTVAGTSGWLYILLFALLNTTLHYAFFYIGLSNTSGSRAAILNSLGVFLVVLSACAFFKSDKLTIGKIIGCATGFTGLLILNIGNGESSRFTLLGDGMIIVNTLCSVAAGLLTRGLSRKCDIFVATGYSLFFGGLLLVVVGLLLGGTLPRITSTGVIVLMLLTAISTIGFALYNKLLSCNPVGRVAIFNSLIPIVGVVTSCLCLGEPFYWKYMLSALLVTTGIYVINKK